ncbi:MAG TPA: hypothetical protein VKB41_15930 [Steroidobacteraceae bacterium]|nr:hypothetical protein [Steroidobacteraceae bacterium]
MHAPARRWILAALCGLLPACATTPDQDVREQLDERTGVTVTRMDKALEFYSPRPEQGLDATAFAYLGPLEVNRMGTRTSYLWLSVLPSTELDANARVVLLVDDASVELGVAATAGKQIDLGSRAYPRPASWAREVYLAATPELLTQLAGASSLKLEIDSGGGEVRRYDPWKAELDGLKAFIAKIAPPGE